MSFHRDPWQQHGGMYRPIDDFSRPWVASPVFSTPVIPPWTKETLSESQSYEIPRHSAIGVRSRQGGCELWRLVKDLFFVPNRYEGVIFPAIAPPEEDRPLPRVPHAEWKAWGYYARPQVNGVQVRNSTPGPISPPGVNPYEVFASLRSPGGVHPDRWVPGLRHESLPPRPTRWRLPRPLEPLPFPWECQLNPFLEHKLLGLPPLYFDIGSAPTGILYGEPENSIPLSPADNAQPATWPFLTHMFINGIADDPALPFPWPFMVQNPRGIKCEDLFDAIFENFQQYVSQLEYDDWPGPRQAQCLRAYRSRVALRSDREREFTNGVRRIDFMGERVMFRGLEPNPNSDGWVMFLSSAW